MAATTQVRLLVWTFSALRWIGLSFLFCVVFVLVCACLCLFVLVCACWCLLVLVCACWGLLGLVGACWGLAAAACGRGSGTEIFVAVDFLAAAAAAAAVAAAKNSTATEISAAAGRRKPWTFSRRRRPLPRTRKIPRRRRFPRPPLSVGENRECLRAAAAAAAAAAAKKVHGDGDFRGSVKTVDVFAAVAAAAAAAAAAKSSTATEISAAASRRGFLRFSRQRPLQRRRPLPRPRRIHGDGDFRGGGREKIHGACSGSVGTCNSEGRCSGLGVPQKGAPQADLIPMYFLYF